RLRKLPELSGPLRQPWHVKHMREAFRSRRPFPPFVWPVAVSGCPKGSCRATPEQIPGMGRRYSLSSVLILTLTSGYLVGRFAPRSMPLAPQAIRPTSARKATAPAPSLGNLKCLVLFNGHNDICNGRLKNRL